MVSWVASGIRFVDVEGPQNSHLWLSSLLAPLIGSNRLDQGFWNFVAKSGSPSRQVKTALGATTLIVT